MRQVQARLLDPRAPREPALQPAQQDPRHVAAHGGVPLRGADPPRRVSIRHFDEYGDVADHCTVCHKCEAPCPVDIDFGDVSIAMRNLLARLRKRRFNLGTWAALQFLSATDATRIKLIKAAMIDFGYRAQRLANKLPGPPAGGPGAGAPSPGDRGPARRSPRR